MPNPNLLAVDQHSDHVEPVLIQRLTVAIDPDVGRLGQLLLLPPVNRGDRPTEVSPSSRLDLNECYRPVLLDDQVDVSTPVPKSTAHYPPPPTSEPPLSDSFAQFPEFLLGRGHGPILQRRVCQRVTKKRHVGSIRRVSLLWIDRKALLTSKSREVYLVRIS